jgi:HEAT repeat protein
VISVPAPEETLAMHWLPWLIPLFLVADNPQLLTPPLSESEIQAAADEQTFRAAGLGTQDADLLEFFRTRAWMEADAGELKALAGQLSDPDAKVRARAVGALVARGPLAIPALRYVANNLADADAAALARKCLRNIEGAEAGTLSSAGARLLAHRQPTGAAVALLNYLPFADDASVTEQVSTVLGALAFKGGKPDPALLAALKHKLPASRAAAVEALCRADHPELWPEVRKLLKDAGPGVRLRAALALTRQEDADSIPVLIDLLAELPREERTRAEEALQEFAGDWAPAVGQMKDDAISRKILRDAWAAWWKNTEGPALLEEFRKRTLQPGDRKKVLALVEKLDAKPFAVREKALADLAAFGPLAAPELREAARSKSPERARRAAGLLDRIAKGKQNPLPGSAPRLVGLRRPAGAVEVLLAFLPQTEDEGLIEGVRQALGPLALTDGKPDPALVKALDDRAPRLRQAAADALARHGGAEGRAAAKKLLKDPDPAIRLSVAQALVSGGDRTAVPVLINALAEVPPPQASQAEETLRALAGGRGPEAPTADTAEARGKYRDAWARWWEKAGPKVDLARLQRVTSQPVLGYTLLVEVGGVGGGRVREVTRDGKVRWSAENIPFPVDAYVLGENRFLVAEFNGRRVSERDFKGKVLWSKDGLNNLPVNVQRLSNGNTFIATSNEIMEVDRRGKTLWQHFVNNGISAAYRLRNGEIVCLTNGNECIRMDTKGRELKRFNTGRGGGWTSGIDAGVDGKILVSLPNQGQVAEFDRDGKQLWKKPAPGITSATRLPGGHVLVASYGSRNVVELDRAGRTVWQFRSDQPVFRARRR